MKKLIISPVKALFLPALLLLVILASCTAEGIKQNPVPPVVITPTLPSTPTTLTLKADTALYNGSAKVTVVSTDGQVVKTGNKVVNGFIVFDNLKNDTTITFEATNSNEHGVSQSKTTSILIKVYSPKTTQIHNYGGVHMVSTRGCIDGTQNNPNVVWLYPPLNCDIYQLFANGDGKLTYGPCSSNPGFVVIQVNAWFWNDGSNEQYINFGAGDVWKVTLNSNGYSREQVKNGYYTIQVYEQ